MLHGRIKPVIADEKQKASIMTAFYLLIALSLGALVSMQPAINAQIAIKLGTPLAAAANSIAISLLMVVAAWATISRFEADWSKLFSLPWWTLVGGAAGALFVLGGVLIAPKLGVAVFFTCVVLGQVLGAALIDQFGAFGLAGHVITWPRALGILFVIAGAALTQTGSWFEA